MRMLCTYCTYVLWNDKQQDNVLEDICMNYQALMSTWERYYAIVQYNASNNYLC